MSDNMISPLPAWIESLVDDLAGCIEPHQPMGPLGILYREEEGFWEVQVYPMPVELVGGAVDGTVVLPGFSLDLEQLQRSFARIEVIHWSTQPFSPYDQEGAHISLEGVYQGHELWLQVLAEAPEGEEPGMQLDTSSTPQETAEGSVRLN